MIVHPNIVLGALLVTSLGAIVICDWFGPRATKCAIVAFGVLWGALSIIALTRPFISGTGWCA